MFFVPVDRERNAPADLVDDRGEPEDEHKTGPVVAGDGRDLGVGIIPAMPRPTERILPSLAPLGHRDAAAGCS